MNTDPTPLRSMAKAELRREMRRRLRQVSALELAAASVDLCRQVRAHPAWAPSGVVGLFHPLATAFEPDLTALCSDGGDRVIAFPRVEGQGMTFRQAASPGDLAKEILVLPDDKRIALKQPPATAPSIAPADLDLLLVPGLAFTLSGLRLGRGGGFYDRYLASPGLRAVKLGIALPAQIVPDLPVEDHDHLLDEVLVAG